MHIAHIDSRPFFIYKQCLWHKRGGAKPKNSILILYLGTCTSIISQGLVHTCMDTYTCHVHNMNNNYMTYWAEILLTTQDLIKKYVHVNHWLTLFYGSFCLQIDKMTSCWVIFYHIGFYSSIEAPFPERYFLKEVKE